MSSSLCISYAEVPLPSVQAYGTVNSAVLSELVQGHQCLAYVQQASMCACYQFRKAGVMPAVQSVSR